MCGSLNDLSQASQLSFGRTWRMTLEADSYVLQHLGNIHAQLAQSAAAVGAGFMGGHVRVDLARKMLRQWTAEGFRGHWVFCWSNNLQVFDRIGCLQLFQLQLELLDLAEDLLALRPEEHALQLLDQEHQGLDLAGS